LAKLAPDKRYKYKATGNDFSKLLNKITTYSEIVERGRPSFRDPLYTDFKLENYGKFKKIIQNPIVLRMRFIKQLGMKAYGGRFIGAHHTRFEHSLGCMHLARKLCSELIKKAERNGFRDLKGILNEFMSLMELSGLLHDVGHGPFSHSLDDLLKSRIGSSHEQLTSKIIKEYFEEEIRQLDINVNDVIAILSGESAPYPFLTEMINGEIDIDRLDYLYRDAYYTGVSYSIGPEGIISAMKLTRKVPFPEDEINEVENTLSSSLNKATVQKIIERIKIPEAHLCLDGAEGVIAAENFLVIRKNMYVDVYYDDISRIYEKMISRSVEWVIDNNSTYDINYFRKLENYVKLDDYSLIGLLNEVGGFAKEIVEKIKESKPFKSTPKYQRITPDKLLYGNIQKYEEEIAHELGIEPEKVIIDLIEYRGFKSERVLVDVEGRLDYLEKISSIVNELVKEEGKTALAVYADLSEEKSN